MSVKKNPVKEIKEHLARARGALKSIDHIKTLNSLAYALRIFVKYKISGTDRIGIETTFNEIVKSLPSFNQLTDYIPKNLAYKKGTEVNLLKFIELVLKKLDDDSRGDDDDEAVLGLEHRKMKMLLRIRDYLYKNDMLTVASTVKMILEEFSDHPGIYSAIANNFYLHDRFRESMQYAQTALNKNAKDALAYVVIARAYEALKDKDNAEATYKKALKECGDVPLIYVSLGTFFRNLGMNKQAILCAHKALKGDAENEEAGKLLESLGSPMPEEKPTASPA